MGESACVLQTFSHLSDTAHQAKEDNPMRALGESISFGRFMSESLAWERWSSFNENMYLEEVEKYSKPGSVAQKKAYFEAHYKKRAAALLEQASDTANNENSDDGSHNGRVMDSESFESDSHVTDDKPGEAAVFTVEEDLSCAATKCNSNGESGDTETNAVEEVLVLEKQVDVEYSGKIESPNLHENVENKTVIEVETIKQFEELPLKEIRAINQESAVSETIVKASTTKTRSTSSSKVSVQNRASKLPSSPARAKTPRHSRKENNSTPSGNKIAKDLTDKRRLAPKSIHMSLSLTPSPSPSPSRAGETNKLAQIVQKAKDSRVSVSSAKTPKDCSKTPLRTPAKASANSEPKLRPVTPQSESRRSKPSLQHIAHGSRKVDLKSQSLSIDSKPSSAAGNNVSKAWPSSVSSSFSFRSEERAAKRKEYFQRLEEKSNAREAQKMKLQAKSKEKAEAELRKMRQTLGFKAKPMPDFNHEMPSTPTKIKKLPLTRPRSPKLGRRPNSSTGLETKSLPPKSPCPSVKSDSVRHGMDKRSRPPSRPATSQSKKNPDENAFPKSPELKG